MAKLICLRTAIGKLQNTVRTIKEPVLCETVHLLKNEIFVFTDIFGANLFQRITGVNATEARILWREVEQGILTDLTSRSTQNYPKFRLEITDVSSIFENCVFINGI